MWSTHTRTHKLEAAKTREGGSAEREEESDVYSRRHKTVAMKHRGFDYLLISQTKEELKEPRRKKRREKKRDARCARFCILYTSEHREVHKVESASKTHPPPYQNKNENENRFLLPV